MNDLIAWLTTNSTLMIRIGFTAIARTVDAVLDALENRSASSLDVVLEADAAARRAAHTIIDSLPVPA